MLTPEPTFWTCGLATDMSVVYSVIYYNEYANTLTKDVAFATTFDPSDQYHLFAVHWTEGKAKNGQIYQHHYRKSTSYFIHIKSIHISLTGIYKRKILSHHHTVYEPKVHFAHLK